jgi:hypothetical protein
MYELVCRDCGDDPQRSYRAVLAGRQQARGPYSVEAGIEAFVEHCEWHETTGEQ